MRQKVKVAQALENTGPTKCSQYANILCADLMPMFGARSIVSEVLSGKRRLALSHITRLAEHFGLPAEVFIERNIPSSPDA